MLARLTAKGQVTIPIKVRELLKISYGDVIDFSIEKEKIVLKKQDVLSSAHLIRGLLKAKKHHTDKEISAAKTLALSKKWKTLHDCF